MTALNKLSPWPWATPEPGVYFDMSFDEYLSIPCLQSSHLKKVLISEMDFWVTSWLNPNKDTVDDDTQAKIDGRAYHKRILEGSAAFYDSYFPAYEHSGPDLMDSNKELYAELKSLDVKGMSGKTKPEMIAALLDYDRDEYEDRILDCVRNRYLAQHIGKEQLAWKTIRYIEVSALMVNNHAHLKSWIAGGYPEVTVIWDDPVTGLRFKIRADYLKIGSVIDLKTFANQMGKTLDKAIDHAYANYKYKISAALYLNGAIAAQGLIKQGKVFMRDPARVLMEGWLDSYASTPIRDFRFIFQQKGEAPVAKGRTVTNGESAYKDGAPYIVFAADKFKAAYETYGEDPWIVQDAPEEMHIDQLPNYSNDL